MTNEASRSGRDRGQKHTLLGRFREGTLPRFAGAAPLTSRQSFRKHWRWS